MGPAIPPTTRETRTMPKIYSELLSAFLAACGGGLRQSGKETVFRCPCHTRHANGDANPSGNVRLGDDGRLLVVCRAGCPLKDILAAIGWKEVDLMPPRGGTGWRDSDSSLTKNRKRYGSAGQAAAALARSRRGELVEYYVYSESGRDRGLVARVRLPDGRKEMPQARCEGDSWVSGGMAKPIPM